MGFHGDTWGLWTSWILLGDNPKARKLRSRVKLAETPVSRSGRRRTKVFSFKIQAVDGFTFATRGGGGRPPGGLKLTALET